MTDGRIGYVYDADAKAGPMRNASEGTVIRRPSRGPPWIVVDFDLTKVVVPRWPGKLWRVQVIEAANKRDQEGAGGPPNDQATYVRAISVEVVAEENPSILFGPHGEKLLPLLEAAARLTHLEAEALAKARHPEAAGTYDRAMRGWTKNQNIATPSEELDGVLKFGGASPVNGALAVLYRVVSDRAHAMDGAMAWITRGDDISLAEPWAGAAQVMLDAALALGAPHLVDGLDRQALLSGYLRLSDASGDAAQI